MLNIDLCCLANTSLIYVKSSAICNQQLFMLDIPSYLIGTYLINVKHTMYLIYIKPTVLVNQQLCELC